MMYISIIETFIIGKIIHKLTILQILVCLLFISTILDAQDTLPTSLSMNEAVDLALKNNIRLKNSDLLIKQTELQKTSSFDIGLTEIDYKSGYLYGNENSKNLEVNQNFGSILKHIQTLKKAEINKQISHVSRDLEVKQLTAETKSAYVYWQYTLQIAEIYSEEKILYNRLTEIAELKYKSGDISLMKKVMLNSKKSEINSNYLVSLDELAIADSKIKQLISIDGSFIPSVNKPEMYVIDRSASIVSYEGTKMLELYNSRYLLSQKEVDIQKSIYFPELKAGGFRQSVGEKDNLYGWQIGIAFPLWIPKVNADIKQADINREIAMNNLEQQKQAILYETENLLFELNKYFHQIIHYEETALKESEVIINTASLQLQNEEIEYSEYLEYISAAYQIRRQYCHTILNYNLTAIQLEIYAE